MRILNLTQHNPSPEQVAAGVFDPDDKVSIRKDLLTFDDIPTREEINQRAKELAEVALAHDADGAMIGGASYLMGPLERALSHVGVKPLHSFTRREAGEEKQADGSVRKTQVFRHVGFVVA